jgi:DNA-nicking Smr family endonuclease
MGNKGRKKPATGAHNGEGRSGGGRNRGAPTGQEPASRPVRIAAAVEEELDLHGLAIDEAMAQVEMALARWRNRPGACIRVIHGKSSGTRDSIKGMFRHNLETRWKGKVAAYRQEPANPGATLVFPA